MFVDCDDEVLGRRYTETRRRHPLAQGRPVADGIALERRLVAQLRARADLIIDSSSMAPADLRQQLPGRFSLAGDRKRVGEGKRVSVRVDCGGGRALQKKKKRE